MKRNFFLFYILAAIVIIYMPAKSYSNSNDNKSSSIEINKKQIPPTVSFKDSMQAVTSGMTAKQFDEKYDKEINYLIENIDKLTNEKLDNTPKVNTSLSSFVASQVATPSGEDKSKKTKTPIKKTNQSPIYNGNLSSYDARLADNSGSGQSNQTSSYSSATLAGIKEKTTHLVDVFSRNVSDHYRYYNPEPPVQETLEAKTLAAENSDKENYPDDAQDKNVTSTDDGYLMPKIMGIGVASFIVLIVILLILFILAYFFLRYIKRKRLIKAQIKPVEPPTIPQPTIEKATSIDTSGLKFCIQCGKQIHGSSKFCPHCGAEQW